VPEPIKPPSEIAPLNTIQKALLEGEVIEALQTVYDPELPVDVYNLGLIYDVQVSEWGDVHILMTLTSPACPVAEILPIEVENCVALVNGVRSVRVELTWDPPYTLDRMPDHVKLELGLL
jgi:FeS assembly SUF system protein